MSQPTDIETKPGFVIRQLGEIEVNGQDGLERIDGLLLEGSATDIRAAGQYFGQRVVVVPADTISALSKQVSDAVVEPKIAVIRPGEGVCLAGRWAGWLFRKHPDGQWVSVQKLELRDPFEGNPLLATLTGGTDA